MLGAILRLIALRPILSFAILGIPVIILAAIGLITIYALKFLVFIVLPIIVIIWVFRKVFGNNSGGPSGSTGPTST